MFDEIATYGLINGWLAVVSGDCVGRWGREVSLQTKEGLGPGQAVHLMLSELLLPDIFSWSPVARPAKHLGSGQLLQLLQVSEQQLLLLLLLLLPELPRSRRVLECWNVEDKYFLLSLPHYLFLPLSPPLLRFCPLHHVDIGQGNSV